MRFLSKKRSDAQLFVGVLRARKDLKDPPCFLFTILAVRKTRINAIAEKSSISKLPAIISVLLSVNTGFANIEKFPIMASYIGFTNYPM